MTGCKMTVRVCAVPSNSPSLCLYKLFPPIVRPGRGREGGELAFGHESALPSGIKQTFLFTSLASQGSAFQQPDPTFGNASPAFQELCHVSDLSDAPHLSANEATTQRGNGYRDSSICRAVTTRPTIHIRSCNTDKKKAAEPFVLTLFLFFSYQDGNHSQPCPKQRATGGR